MAVELKKQAEERKEAEEAFYRNQELMMEAEKRRRDLILLEEQKLADQRVRLVLTMDDLRFRLYFNLSKKNEIYHHS